MSDESEWSDKELMAAGRRAMRELPDASAGAIRRATSIFPEAPGLLTRIQALLSMDSWSSPLPALRSSSSGVRQLLFTSEARDIDIRIAPGDGGWTLEGQVLGDTEAGSLSIRREGGPALQVELDELGTFLVAGLAEGRYALVLYFATERVALPELDIKAQDAS